jgi:hypothetical protein
VVRLDVRAAVRGDRHSLSPAGTRKPGRPALNPSATR